MKLMITAQLWGGRHGKKTRNSWLPQRFLLPIAAVIRVLDETKETAMNRIPESEHPRHSLAGTVVLVARRLTIAAVLMFPGITVCAQNPDLQQKLAQVKQA